MKSVVLSVALAVSASAAAAGGLDRSGQSIAPIFEIGNYVEFSFGSINPSVSGVGAGIAPNPAQPTPGVASGDMIDSYGLFGAAVKAAVNDNVDLAMIIDQPFGADTMYPAGTGYFAGGSVARVHTTSITGIARYKLPNNFSVHGGVRHQRLDASVAIPFAAGYSASADKTGGTGYLVGAAYERPDIALRVALTYNSAISHDLPTTESSLVLGAGNSSTTTVETPQSVNLDFQTGIAQNTLLFGGVRWVNWSEFLIAPADYGLITGGPLLQYAEDTVTYTLGVGRRFSDQWSGAAIVSHEPATDAFMTNLGPVDGATSLGLAMTYSQDNMKITGGVRYIMLGDATTQIAGSGIPAAEFADNHALAFGLKVGFNF